MLIKTKTKLVTKWNYFYFRSYTVYRESVVIYKQISVEFTMEIPILGSTEPKKMSVCMYLLLLGH